MTGDGPATEDPAETDDPAADDAGPGRSRPDLRLLPIAAAAWAAAWTGTTGWRPPTIGWVLAVVLLAGVVTAATRFRAWWLLATTLTVAGTVAAAGLHTLALERSAVHRLADSDAVVSARLTITGDPSVRPGDGIRPPYLTVTGTVLEVSGHGEAWHDRSPVLITAGGRWVGAWQQLPAGARVEAVLRLQAADPGSDLAAVARAAAPPRIVQRPSAPARLVERVRAGLRAAVAPGSPEQRALVPSLVLGDTAGITPRIKADFLATGLTHLTAVSGANLAILLAFLVVLARWFGVRGWWLRLIGLAAVVVFVALCRAEPSVLRAAAMGLVALTGTGLSGRGNGIRSLCLAMTMLLVADPWLARSLGFVLSVLATGGIIWWARRWAEAMHRWTPMIIAESIMVPLAAHLATLPVAAAISGQVSMVGILTNAVAGPFVGPATVLGFAAAGLSLLASAPAALAGRLACWSAQPILWTAHVGAGLPGASWTWPLTPVALGLLAGACLALAWSMPVVARRPWATGLLMLAMIIGVLRAPVQPGWPPRNWLLVACDIGQGDGLAVRTGDRQAIIIDTGPDPLPMRRCLDQLGIQRVPLLIMTHFHADHVGGLAGALSGRRVERIWVSPYPSPRYEERTVEATAAGLHIPVSTPGPGVRARIGAATLLVIGPVDRGPVPAITADGQSSTENDLSLVIMITVGAVRMLLAGDVEPEEQHRILQTRVDLRADVLKVPHHGSSRQDAGFIAATGARVAIASAGRHNSYGHPAPRTMQLLRDDGMTAVCTCTSGSIAVVAGNPGRGGTAGAGREIGLVAQRG